MKFYCYLIISFFLFSACSDTDKIEQEIETSSCGNDVVFTSILKYSEQAETRSSVIEGFPYYQKEGETWDNGYVDSDGTQAVVNYYPGTTLYLIAEKEDGTRLGDLEFSVNSQKTGPDFNPTYTQSLTMRFYLRDSEPNKISIQSIGDGDDPTVDNPSKTLTLDFTSNDRIRLYFSSQKNNEITLTETVTRGEETLYKPAGDDYFRSEFRYITIQDGKMKLTDYGATTYSEICESDLYMQLNRCTAILNPVLLVTEDRTSADQTTFELTDDEFKTETNTDDITNWKVWYYAKYPIKYQMYSNYESNAVGNCIIEEGSVQEIALSNVGVTTSFEEVRYSTNYSSTGGQPITYIGMGGGDASFPFVFWADADRLRSADAEIYAVITNPSGQTKKLTVSLENTPIQNGNHEQVYIVIGISDLKRGFGIGDGGTTLRSSDNDILDIPYKVFVKSNPL